MSLYDILDQVVELLESRRRVTYRALKREFNLDDDFRIPPLAPGPNPIAGNRIAAGHAVIPDNDFEEVNQLYIGWRSHTGGCPNSPDPCSGK